MDMVTVVMDTATVVMDTATVVEAMDTVTVVMDTATDNRKSQQRRKEKSSVRNFTLTGMTTKKMPRPTSLLSGSMR